jgi:DNA polymerase III epsilon subunit-like protein
VQLAYLCTTNEGKPVERRSFLIKTQPGLIEPEAAAIHRITEAETQAHGYEALHALAFVAKKIGEADLVVCHNVAFDKTVLAAHLHTLNLFTEARKVSECKTLCTMDKSTDFCALPGGFAGKFKWPKLAELHSKLFGPDRIPDGMHDAFVDVQVTYECFFELLRRGIITL